MLMLRDFGHLNETGKFTDLKSNEAQK